MAETITHVEFFIFSLPHLVQRVKWRMDDFPSIFPALTETREPGRVFGGANDHSSSKNRTNVYSTLHISSRGQFVRKVCCSAAKHRSRLCVCSPEAVLPAAQGHSSLERKYGYDTYRNEAYGFVDVIVDLAGSQD